MILSQIPIQLTCPDTPIAEHACVVLLHMIADLQPLLTHHYIQPAGFTASDDEDDMCVGVMPSSQQAEVACEADVLQVGLTPACNLLHTTMQFCFARKCPLSLPVLVAFAAQYLCGSLHSLLLLS